MRSCYQRAELEYTAGDSASNLKVWTMIFQRLGLNAITPQPTAAQFSVWWSNAISRVPKVLREGLNSLIILLAWELWKHQNYCVFEGTNASVQLVLPTMANDSGLWCLVGTSALHKLLIRSLSPDSCSLGGGLVMVI